MAHDGRVAAGYEIVHEVVSLVAVLNSVCLGVHSPRSSLFVDR